MADFQESDQAGEFPLERPMATSSRIRALSLSRAAAAFQGFSLSKYRDQPPPPTHVPAGGNRAAIHRTAMEESLRQLRELDASNGGLVLSLPPEMLHALPSYNPDVGTVDATELMSLFDRYRHGSEFYVQGHPTVTRLELLRRAQELIAEAIQKEKVK
jgi:hypothetical protein